MIQAAAPGPIYVCLAEYAALHGATYQQVYGWVRFGYVPCERRDGHWCVPRDAPRPHVRRGCWDQAERLQLARAAITLEGRRRGGLRTATRIDPEQRREWGRRGGLAGTKRRRNHGLCRVCQ